MIHRAHGRSDAWIQDQNSHGALRMRRTEERRSPLSWATSMGARLAKAVGLGPDIFRWIEFRGVSQELFHPQPGMGSNPVFNRLAAMNGSPIPQQDHGTSQMPKQVTQEGSDIQPREIAAAQPEVERPPPARGRHGQRPDRGEPILLIQIVHDRRAAFRRPGTGHVGDEQKARFIKKDEVGPTSSSVFLYRASGTVSIGRSRPRPVARRGVRASDNSSPTGSGASRHDRDDSAPRTAGGSAAPRVSRSRDRCDSLWLGAPSGAAPPAASSAPRRDWGDDRVLAVAAIQGGPVCGRPRPTGIRNSRKHPRPVQSPTERCPP